MKILKNYGPFSYYSIKDKKEKSHFIDIGLKGYDGFGWEWGSDSVRDFPIISLRLAGFTFVYFEKFESGFEVWFMGFWWIKE